MGWVSPTGFNDPEEAWSVEENAYDENTATNAWSYPGPKSWSDYLELTIGAISCDKVQFWARYESGEIEQISLDVYYESAWHNIYEGIFADREWVEKTIPAGTKTVTAARAKFFNDSTLSKYVNFYEFEFNKITAYSPATRSANMAAKMIAGKLI